MKKDRKYPTTGIIPIMIMLQVKKTHPRAQPVGFSSPLQFLQTNDIIIKSIINAITATTKVPTVTV